MEIASLIEYIFLQLIPLPEWNNNRSNDLLASQCWNVNGSSSIFYKMRDVLCDISAIYTAACESMVLNGSQPTRVITHAAIMCSFYHIIRMGPPSPSDDRDPLKAS